MKTKFIYTLALSSLLLCSSCNSFLDEAPRGNSIAQTVDDYDAMFDGSQNFNMQFFEQYYALWRSDDLIFTDGSLSTIAMCSSFPTSVENAIQFKETVYRDDETTPEFTKIYNQIYMYNSIADGVKDATGDETQKKYLLAEARVSRAYMHFLAAQWFAAPYSDANASKTALPIVTEANTQVTDFQCATVKDYYDWIVKEMEEAVPNLEERTEHKMRCYKATGYALLGKVYFYMNQYDKALPYLQKAYSLLQGDANVYLTDHVAKQQAYGYKEMTMNQMMGYVAYPYRDNEVLFCKCSSGMRQYYPAYYYMEPTDYLKPEVYALYGDNDVRRNVICTKGPTGKAYTYPTATFVGAMTNVGITLPEVYLMLAESEARVGSEANAKDVLVKFRATRILSGSEGIPATVTDRNSLIKFCFDEEQREFAGTGFRYYTVRRLWNDALFQDQKPITHTVGSQTYTMSESQLYWKLPETVLLYNEDMR